LFPWYFLKPGYCGNVYLAPGIKKPAFKKAGVVGLDIQKGVV